MKPRGWLNQRVDKFTMKDLILIVLSCVIFGIVIGALTYSFSVRYVIWLFILFILLGVRPAYVWIKKRDVKRRVISDEI